MAVTFESMDRRMPKIEKCLAEYGIANLEKSFAQILALIPMKS